MYIEIEGKTVRVFGETPEKANRNAIEFFNIFIGQNNWLEYGPACLYQMYAPGKQYFIPIKIKDFAADFLKKID